MIRIFARHVDSEIKTQLAVGVQMLYMSIWCGSLRVQRWIRGSVFRVID